MEDFSQQLIGTNELRKTLFPEAPSELDYLTVQDLTIEKFEAGSLYEHRKSLR